ncbi:hypothetical protein GINT2_001885 [Glugoides intestinalis]
MKKLYKIVFLGNTAVGKTTLISQYLYSKVHTPTPTIGIDFLSAIYNANGKLVRLQLWDTAGQERFHSIVGNYTRNTFLAIIVFSVDDQKSLEKAITWINDFVLIHNAREEVNLMIVANKSDIDGKEMIEKGRMLANDVGAKFVVTHALTREGIEEMVVGINEFIQIDLEKTGEDTEEVQNKIEVVKVRRRCC